MEARAMNVRTWAQAAALSVALMANGAPTAQAAAPAPLRAPSAAMRTLLKYWDGAWTAPAAVVLRSAKDWNDWNDEMVARGMAIGREPLPANVNWAREAVLVVSAGSNAAAVELKNARRIGLRVEVELAVSYHEGGTSPCHVVAMDKRLLKNVRVMNADQIGLASQVRAYSPNSALVSTQSMPVNLAASWGEVKGAYRQ